MPKPVSIFTHLLSSFLIYCSRRVSSLQIIDYDEPAPSYSHYPTSKLQASPPPFFACVPSTLETSYLFKLFLVPTFGLLQSTQLLGLGLYNFFQPGILLLVINKITLKFLFVKITLKFLFVTLTYFSLELKLTISIGYSDKLRIVSIGFSSVCIVSHNFIGTLYREI